MFGHFCGLDYVRVFFLFYTMGPRFVPFPEPDVGDVLSGAHSAEHQGGRACRRAGPAGSSGRLSHPAPPGLRPAAPAGAATPRGLNLQNGAGSEACVRAGGGTGVKSSTEPPRARRLPTVAHELNHRPHTGPLGSGAPLRPRGTWRRGIHSGDSCARARPQTRAPTRVRAAPSRPFTAPPLPRVGLWGGQGKPRADWWLSGPAFR